MDGRYMTVAEVAELFSVSTTLLYRLIQDEVIPAIRIGHKNYRISPETVQSIKDGGLLS